MEIFVPDIRNGYVSVCQTVAKHGEVVTVRGLTTLELTGVTIRLHDVQDVITLPTGVGRQINTKLAAVEALCMIGGVWKQRQVERAAPNYGDVLVSHDEAAANAVAYGTRIRTQLPAIMLMLKNDPTTRQAILSIWDLTDLTRVGDRPCTLTLQFLLRQGRLECHVYMRSQDVWLGLGMDIFVFTQLQMTIGNYLGVPPGQFVHHVGSLHVYDRDLDRVAALRPVDPQLRPLHDDFPRGVLTPKQDPVKYMQQARMLLDGIASRPNPWYERQISKLYESA